MPTHQPDFLTYVYAAYALFSVALTIWLARILGTNGRLFLHDVFPDSPDLGDAVNRLLVVGFYLVNFGYSCLHLAGGNAGSVQAAIETLATKLGSLLIALAVVHFGNLYVFHRIRRARVVPTVVEPVAYG